MVGVFITPPPQEHPGPSCHFLVHVILDNCVFLECYARRGQSLGMSKEGVAGLANFGEEETQFVVRVEVCAMMIITLSPDDHHLVT